MAKADLPRDVRRTPLDYDRLLSVLDMIEGECVIVRLAARGEDEPQSSGLASIVGQLKHVPARYEGHEFSIGSPYPDLYPEYLAGGVLFLNQQVFESAVLTTYDGNDYFAIEIKTSSLDILVNDADSTGP